MTVLALRPGPLGGMGRHDRGVEVTSTMIAQLKRHRFSLESYEAMAERGIFAPDDRVELLRGEIVDVSPIGSRHAACVKQLNALFFAAFGSAVTVGVQDPVGLPPDSEPEPDVSVLKPRGDFYAGKHPRPEDVLLLVEVSETTLHLDRSCKLPLYAEAGIPEVWIVNVVDEEIETYAVPRNGRYERSAVLRRGETVAISALPHARFEVDRMLPRET